ncbi:MAG TPA: DMT family transporter [Methylomirabilota bacterium]|nr:DMT family transporter [Methylomirabilota bacterium]
MPLGALALVLIAALCHATWNLLLKTEPRRLQVQSGALTVGVVLASPVLFIYSVGTICPAAWLLIVLSALFETAYVFTLTAAYGAGDLSLVYPVARGTAPLVVSPLAVALLGENLSGPGVAGIALIVLGIWLSHLGVLTGHAVHQGRLALALAVFTGLMTAGYSLVNKVGVALVPVPLYAFLVFVINVTLIHVALALRGRQPWLLRRDLPWARTLAVGVLMIVAYLGVLLAMTQAPVAYVVAAREVSIPLAAILGWLVLGESNSRSRLAGAVVIFAGLALMALGR